MKLHSEQKQKHFGAAAFFDTLWTHPHVDGRRIMRPALSQHRQWASTPTDLTHPTFRPFSSSHVLFNATTRSEKCQRRPRLHAGLCDFVLLTFYHQMPSLSPCQSSWLYEPLQEGEKSFKMTAVVICTTISATQASGRISIPATQLLRYLIDLMKYVRSDVRTRANTKAWLATPLLRDEHQAPGQVQRRNISWKSCASALGEKVKSGDFTCHDILRIPRESKVFCNF